MTSRIIEMEDFSPRQLKKEALNEWISLGFDADTFSLQKLTETWLLQDRKSVEATEEEELFRAKQQLVREYHAERTPLRELRRVGKAIAHNVTSRFGEATDTSLSHQKPTLRQHAKDARQMSRDTHRYQSLKSTIYEGYRLVERNSVLRQRCNEVKPNGTPRPKRQKEMSIADFDNSKDQLPIIEPRQVVSDTIDHDRGSQKNKQAHEEGITRRERNAKFWKEKHGEGKILTFTTHSFTSLSRSNSEQKYKSCSLVTDDNLDNLKEYMKGTFPRPQVNINEEFKRKELKKKVASEAKSLRKKIDDLNDMLKILSTEHEINAQLFETQSLHLNDIEKKQQVIQNITQSPPRRDPTANEKVELHRLALQKQQCRNQITCLNARSVVLKKKIGAVKESRTGPSEKLYALQKHEDIGRSNINSTTRCESPVIAERSIVSPRSKRDIYPEDDENSTDLMLGNMKKSSSTLHDYHSVTRKARLCLLERRLAPIFEANESLKKLSAHRWCSQSINNSDLEESELLKGRLSEHQAHIFQTKNLLQRSALCHEIEHFHQTKTLRKASYAIVDSYKLWEHSDMTDTKHFQYSKPQQMIILTEDNFEGVLCGSFDLPRCLMYRFGIHAEQSTNSSVSGAVFYQNLNYDLKVFAGSRKSDRCRAECGVHILQQGKLHRHYFDYYGKTIFYRIEIKKIGPSFSSTNDSMDEPIRQHDLKWQLSLQNSIYLEHYKICEDFDNPNLNMRLLVRRKPPEAPERKSVHLEESGCTQRFISLSYLQSMNEKLTKEVETRPEAVIALLEERIPFEPSSNISAKEIHGDGESTSLILHQALIEPFDLPTAQLEIESPDSNDKAGDEARVFSDSLISCLGINAKPLCYPLGEGADGIKKNTLISVKEPFEMTFNQRDNLLRVERDSAKKHRKDGSYINEHAMLDSEVTLKKYTEEGYRDLLHNENIYTKEVTARLLNNPDDITLHQYELSDRDRQEIVHKRAKEKMALRMKILAKKGERVKKLKCRERLSNGRNSEFETQHLVSLMKNAECAAFEVNSATLADNSHVCQGNYDPESCQKRLLVPQIDLTSLVKTQSCIKDDVVATDFFNKEFDAMEIKQSRFYDSNRQRCIEKLHARHNQEDTFVGVDVNRSSPLYQRLVEERHRVAFYEEIQFHTRLTRFQTRIQQLTDEISHNLMKQSTMNHKNAQLEAELDAMRSHVCKFERDYFQAHSRVKEIDDSLELLRTSIKAVALWKSKHQIALQECEALDSISNREETRLRALEKVCNRSEIRLRKMNQYYQYRKITLADIQDKLTKIASECQKLRESVLRNFLHETGRKVLTPIGLGTITESRLVDGIISVYLPHLQANIHIRVEHLLLYELKTTSEEVIAMRAEEEKARKQMLWVAQGELRARDCMQMEDYLSSKMMLSPRDNAANTKMTMETAFEKESDSNTNSGLDSENVVIRRGSASGENFKAIAAQPSVTHAIVYSDGRSRGIRKPRTYQLDSNAERCTRQMFMPSIWFPSRSLSMLQRFPPVVCVHDMQLMERLNCLWESRKKKHSERYDAWRRERITLQEFGLRCQEQQRRLNDIARQRRQQRLMLLEEQSCRRFYKMEKLGMIREQEGMILEESLLRLNPTSIKASTFTNILLSRRYGQNERIMERRLEIKLEKQEKRFLRKVMQMGKENDISGRSRDILHTASMEPRDQFYEDSTVTIAKLDDVDESLQPRDDRRLYLKIDKACIMKRLSQCELTFMRLREHASDGVICLEYMIEKIEQQKLYLQQRAKKTTELADSISKRRVCIHDTNLKLAEVQVKLGSAQELNENASAHYDDVLAQNSSMDSAILHGTTQRYKTRQLYQSLHELYFKSLIEFLLSNAIKEHHVRKMMSMNENIKHNCQERNCKAKQMKILVSKHHRQRLMSLRRSKLPIFKASRRIGISNSFSRWKIYRLQSIRVRATFDLKYQIILQSGIEQ